MNKRKHFQDQHVAPLTGPQQKMRIYRRNIQVQGHKKQTRRYNLHLAVLPGREKTAGSGTDTYLGTSFVRGQRNVHGGTAA